MIPASIAIGFLVGWFSSWALTSWIDHREMRGRLPPATARQLARAYRAGRLELRTAVSFKRTTADPPPSLDHFDHDRTS